MSLSRCWLRLIRFIILLALLLQFSTNTILWRCVLYKFNSFFRYIFVCIISNLTSICFLSFSCQGSPVCPFCWTFDMVNNNSLLHCLSPPAMSYLLKLLPFHLKMPMSSRPPAQMAPHPLVQEQGGGWGHVFNAYCVRNLPINWLQ